MASEGIAQTFSVTPTAGGTLVKTGRGKLKNITIHQQSGASKWVQIYDALDASDSNTKVRTYVCLNNATRVYPVIEEFDFFTGLFIKLGTSGAIEKVTGTYY